jgi:hypothetical protein
MRLGLGNTLVNNGLSNPDKLSLDLNFAVDKTLTARRGPNPVLTRANTAATYVSSNGTIQNATTNVARFDHNTSYDTSYIVLSGSPLDSNGSPIDIAQALPFNSWDGNSPVEYPVWGSGYLSLSTDGTNWLLQDEDGNFSSYRSFASGANGSYAISTGSGSIAVTVVQVCKGLLIEEQRENILLNTTGNLSTQSVTVTAIPHTLSFYGAGQIVLSGAKVATITPSELYGYRQTYVFTPTAGTLVLTVTGVVQYAQLERVNSSTGASCATSYIPTTSASVVRSADVCSISGSNFTNIYNSTEFSIFAEAIFPALALQSVCGTDDGTNNNQAGLLSLGDGACSSYAVGAGAAKIASATPVTANTMFKIASTYKSADYKVAKDGTLYTPSSTSGIPAVTSLKFGKINGGAYLNGCIKSLRFYKKSLTASKLQSITT